MQGTRCDHWATSLLNSHNKVDNGVCLSCKVYSLVNALVEAGTLFSVFRVKGAQRSLEAGARDSKTVYQDLDTYLLRVNLVELAWFCSKDTSSGE